MKAQYNANDFIVTFSPNSLHVFHRSTTMIGGLGDW